MGHRRRPQIGFLLWESGDSGHYKVKKDEFVQNTTQVTARLWNGVCGL